MNSADSRKNVAGASHRGRAGVRCRRHIRQLRIGKAFTLIELLVVIATIALLVTLLMPSLKHAKELARRAVCLANQRHIVQSLALYADDNDEQLPNSPEGWWNGAQTWVCWQGYARDKGVWGHSGPGWVHLGKVYEHRLIPSPKLLFCPSLTKFPHVYPRGWGDETMDPTEDLSGWHIHPWQKKPAGYMYGLSGQAIGVQDQVIPALRISEMHSMALVSDMFVGHWRKLQELPLWPHAGGIQAGYGDGSARFTELPDSTIQQAIEACYGGGDIQDYYSFAMFKMLSGDPRFLNAYPDVP